MPPLFLKIDDDLFHFRPSNISDKVSYAVYSKFNLLLICIFFFVVVNLKLYKECYVRNENLCDVLENIKVLIYAIISTILHLEF